VRHRQVDRSGPDLVRPARDTAAEGDGGLWATRNLDIAPGKRTRDTESQRLPHGFLAGEAACVALRRIRPPVAVRLFRRREAALAETGIPLERAADALDLDQVDADFQWFSR
jgi:hypothetical protein